MAGARAPAVFGLAARVQEGQLDFRFVCCAVCQRPWQNARRTPATPPHSGEVLSALRGRYNV